MKREEFIRRNPVRILKKSIHGGLEPGNVAVIASPKGVGKTACLVYIATVSLIQGKQIIHVSFSARTDHIVNWYEETLKAMTDKNNIEDSQAAKNEVSRNRVIMNFNQDGLIPEQIFRSLKAMIKDGNFAADIIIVDGYNLAKSNVENFKAFKNFAAEMGLCIWFSASLLKPVTACEVPEELLPFMDYVDVLVTLADKKDHVALQLVKDCETYIKEDLSVRLDPRTLLIAEE